MNPWPLLRAAPSALLLGACVYQPQPGMHWPRRAQVAQAMAANVEPCQLPADGISTCDVKANAFHVTATRCGPEGVDVHGAPVLFCRVTYRPIFPGGWSPPDASAVCFPFQRNPGQGWRVAEINGAEDRCGGL